MEMNMGLEVKAEKESSIRSLFGKIDVRSYTMIGALILIWVMFTLINENFLSARNLSNLFTQMSVTAILAVGVVMVIVSGNIDLSVGSLVGLTGGVAAILSSWLNLPTPVVILATMLFGSLVGLFQGWLIAYRAIPAFIVTLGGYMAFRGILIGVTKATTISISDPAFVMLGSAYFTREFGLFMGALAILGVAWSVFNRRKSRLKYGFDVSSPGRDIGKVLFYSGLISVFVITMNSYKGIPFPMIFVVILALIFTFIAQKTSFGRHIYAIGGNPEAARLSGINIKRRVMTLFVFSGLLASVAAIVLTARLSAATITAGQNYEMDAIAAAVIGGTSLMGGSGTIFGALIGALVMASLDNGMSLLGIESFWQYIVKGSILVLAVWVDISSRNKKAAK